MFSAWSADPQSGHKIHFIQFWGWSFVQFYPKLEDIFYSRNTSRSCLKQLSVSFEKLQHLMQFWNYSCHYCSVNSFSIFVQHLVHCHYWTMSREWHGWEKSWHLNGRLSTKLNIQNVAFWRSITKMDAFCLNVYLQGAVFTESERLSNEFCQLRTFL